MKKISYIVVAGLIRDGDKFLVVYKHTSTSDKCRNKWELPGGKAKNGFSMKESLKNKLYDYLGVEVEVSRFLPKIYFNKSLEKDLIKYFNVYVGECTLNNNKINLNKEKLSDYKWITIDEAYELHNNNLLVEGDLEFMKMAASKC